MPLVTVGEARALVETDLPDASLQLLIDDAEATIVRRFGANYPTPVVSEHITGWHSYPRTLYLSRPALTVSSVVAYTGYPYSTTATTLETTDYRATLGGRGIERVGGSWAWDGRTVVTYVPVDDNPTRKRVIVDLVRLAVRYSGVSSQTIGSLSENLPDYEAERERILAALAPALEFA